MADKDVEITIPSFTELSDALTEFVETVHMPGEVEVDEDGWPVVPPEPDDPDDGQ